MVTDARHHSGVLSREHHKATTFIPYGADAELAATADVLARMGLEKYRYFLYVSRLEPENHALEVRQAFEKVPTDLRLALIGDAPYAGEYIHQVRDTGDPRLVMPGAIYGQGTRNSGPGASRTFTRPRSGARIPRSSKPWGVAPW